MRLVTLLAALLLSAPALAADVDGAVQQEIALAAQAGLPVRVLEAKALEGAAKGVAPERIAAAVRSLRAQLADARLVLDLLDPSEDDVEAGARALAAGSTSQALTSVALRHDARAEALRCLGDLLHGGLVEDHALALIATARETSDPISALRGLASASALMLAEDVPAAVVVARIQDALAHGRPPLSVVPDAAGLAAPTQAGNSGSYYQGGNRRTRG